MTMTFLTHERMKSIVGWALTAGIVTLWFVAFRPPMLGGPASTIAVNGISMDPTFADGDLVIVHEKDEYEVGDIVAFRIPEGDLAAGARVVHRIVDGDATDGFVMKGDNNSYTDKWRPSNDEIIGAKWLHVPYGASLLSNVRRPIVLASLTALAGFLVVVTRSPRRRDESADETMASTVADAVRVTSSGRWATVALIGGVVATVVVRRRIRD